MRLVAALLTLAALGAAGIAGRDLWLEVTQPPAPPAPARVVAMAPGEEPKAPRPPRRWPALFGEPEPPAPPPPPEPEPEPPAPEPEPQPPAPTLSSLGYSLKGLVRTGTATWALLSHPTGERVIRPGDEIEDGLTVTVIDAQGVWVARDGAEPELLAFEE